MRKRKQTGFTMIELLVTIALIGFLAALIFGATQRVFARSRQAQATSNIRQWVVALTMYADDYRGLLPSIGQSGANIVMTNTAAWFNALPPYIGEIPLQQTRNPRNHATAPGYGRYPRPGDRNIFMCPTIKNSSLLSPPPSATTTPMLVYGYNEQIEQGGNPPIRWQNIERFASRFAVIGELAINASNPSLTSRATINEELLGFRHGGGNTTILGFADGHVESFLTNDVTGVIWNPVNP
jgi:prepilin-type N-terminal cleavage/methylation domain-containing protein/prepilin-type processing-associated H-X9-DG protein